jgi:hypothetical protein
MAAAVAGEVDVAGEAGERVTAGKRRRKGRRVGRRMACMWRRKGARAQSWGCVGVKLARHRAKLPNCTEKIDYRKIVYEITTVAFF